MLKIESDSAGQTKVVVHKRDEASLLQTWTQLAWLASKLQNDEQLHELGECAGVAADGLEKVLRLLDIIKQPGPEHKELIKKLQTAQPAPQEK